MGAMEEMMARCREFVRSNAGSFEEREREAEAKRRAAERERKIIQKREQLIREWEQIEAWTRKHNLLDKERKRMAAEDLRTIHRVKEEEAAREAMRVVLEAETEMRAKRHKAENPL